MSNVENLPELPDGWYWEDRSPCYTKTAVNDETGCSVWKDDDGFITIDGDEWVSHSAPASVVVAVLKANGVEL